MSNGAVYSKAVEFLAKLRAPMKRRNPSFRLLFCAAPEVERFESQKHPGLPYKANLWRRPDARRSRLCRLRFGHGVPENEARKRSRRVILRIKA